MTNENQPIESSSHQAPTLNGYAAAWRQQVQVRFYGERKKNGSDDDDLVAQANAYYAEQNQNVINAKLLAVDGFVLYPNPANTQIHLAYKDFDANSIVTIFDYTGNHVINMILANTTGITDIDVHQLNAGVYLYQVVNNSGNITKQGKFTIVK